MAKKNIATFLGPNQGLSIVGNHAYALSGKIETGAQSTPITMLEFVTGQSYIRTKIVLQHTENTTDDILFEIKFNGELILAHLGSRVDLSVISTNYLPVIMPPHTHVLITCQNESGATTRDTYATIEGRVYDA